MSPLFGRPAEGAPHERFPGTRYLGSKRKLLPLLAGVFSSLDFDSALDPFCGTCAVAYLLKTMGKAVTAADALESCAVAARGLIENSTVTLDGEAAHLAEGLPDPGPPAGFVERTFDEVFFERDENRFVDQILARIRELDGPSKDLALLALFQACLAKRPYNLFHRANLSMRRRDVPRTFGNKTTWETGFDVLFERFAAEADRAVAGFGRPCSALCADALEIDPSGHDMVYLDPPYVSARGAGVDYLDYYHFLEGLCRPEEWGERILHRYRHKPLAGRGGSPFCDPARIGGAFREAIERFSSALLVVSYRSDGIPSVEEIAGFLSRAGKRPEILDAGRYTYALSRNRRSREVVLVGR